MRSELATELLDKLLSWDEEDPDPRLRPLMAMADWKWDGYEGFRAGQRFLESFARWLQGFGSLEQRLRWVDFVLNEMIFISSAEMDQAITCVYPMLVRPMMLGRAAASTGLAPYRTAELARSNDFRTEMRRTLVLGLSDGAKLDLLRRSSPGLSHEQFSLALRPAPEQRRGMLTKLASALSTWGTEQPTSFAHVLLVDDFYGSGTSLVSVEDVDGVPRVKPSSKLGQFLDLVREDEEQLRREEGGVPLLASDYTVTIVLYVASHRAETYIRDCLSQAGLADKERFTLFVIQRIPDAKVVADQQLLADCDVFWDEALEDEHKGRSARGYKDCALPVVLHHNAPNNSVSPLWADSTDRGGKDMRALFPRYERHHADRP